MVDVYKELHRSLKVIASIASCSSISLVAIIVSNIVLVDAFGYEETASNVSADMKAFIAFVMISPVVETLIFQSVLVGFVRNKIKNKDPYIVVMSAVLFGFWHYYNIFYMAVTAVVGFVFSWVYLCSLKSRLPAFFIVFSSHLLTNFILFLLIHESSGG